MKPFSGQAAQSYEPKIVAAAARMIRAREKKNELERERGRELGMKYEVADVDRTLGRVSRVLRQGHGCVVSPRELRAHA